MSALGEKTLIAHLVDPDAIQVIAYDGLDPTVLPTAELRPVLTFCLDYYYASGCEKAPSVAVLRSEFGDTLNDAEVDIEHEPEDSIEWAIDDLKATWVHAKSMKFNKEFATAMAEADKAERLAVVHDYATELVGLGLSMESRSYRADLRESGDQILRDYEARSIHQAEFRDMGFGLQAVDQHTYGIHRGELALMAAGPKTGKSFFQCWVALREWRRGRSVAMFTLENSVDMMLNRIACMDLTIDARAWEHGEATEEEVARVRRWVEDIKQAPNALWVLKPDLGQRSFQHMVREAQLRGADSLLIDQLTHVEVGHGDRDHRPRHEKIGEALHILKAMISTGRHPMPCLLTHQINRDGVKSADKAGHLEMWHLAEAAECERTADFIFGLYQSRDEFAVHQAKLQTLGARRVAPENWQIQWRPSIGSVRTKGTIQFD